MKPEYPINSDDVYVTKKMLLNVRDELKSDIHSLDKKLSAEIDQTRDEVKQLRSEIRVSQKKTDSKIEKMQSDLHYMKALMEEQNNKNNIVLKGLASLFARQDRVETRVDHVEKFVQDPPRKI